MSLRYLITFSCYGTHLHGDEGGSVDPKGHNLFKGPALPADPCFQLADRHRMDQGAYILDAGCRLVVLNTICQVCSHRGWILLAAHVRSTHVHAVVEAEAKPEKVLNDFKAYASRRLNEAGDPERKRWARHGSTRWLLKDQNVREAIQYVVDLQGEPMAVFNAGLL